MKEKSAKKLEIMIDRLQTLSVAAMGAASLVLSLSALFGFTLPLWLTRTLGIVNLLALPLLVYATAQRFRMKKAAPEPQKNPGGKKTKKKKKKKK